MCWTVPNITAVTRNVGKPNSLYKLLLSVFKIDLNYLENKVLLESKEKSLLKCSG